MRVINHNWSATKQRFFPRSVAEISRYSYSNFVKGSQADWTWLTVCMTVSFYHCFGSMLRFLCMDLCDYHFSVISIWPHWDVMLVWRKGLCTIIMVHKGTSSSYRSVDTSFDTSFLPGSLVPVAGDNVEVIESFTYLGVNIHNTGSSEHDPVLLLAQHWHCLCSVPCCFVTCLHNDAVSLSR